MSDTHEVINPWSGEVVWSRAADDAARVSEAVSDAHAAASVWAATPSEERASRLRAAADTVAAHTEDLVAVLVRTIGKPRRACAVEVRRTVEMMRLCAADLARHGGETLPVDAVPGGGMRWSLTFREPYGVAALVTPFNAPLNLLAQKLAPALACGNTVVVKPSVEGAAVTEAYVDLIGEHFPAGTVQVVHGAAETALALVSDSRVRVVSLTGGTAAGEAVLAAAGVKPVHLELGSNSPNIVLADADISDAATKIARAAFEASGQQCISAQRIFVADSVRQQFEDYFVKAASELVVGDPDDAATEVGPVVHDRSAGRVQEFIADAERRGGRVLLDGRDRTVQNPRLIGPTIVADVPDEATVMCEEVFGPVAVVRGVSGLDEAVALANDVPGLLQASCFTRDLGAAVRAGRELWAGSVWINEATRFRLDVHPFGGTGTSGLGREGVRYAMDAFSQVKHVGIALP